MTGSRLSAALLLVGVFAAGAATGAVGMSQYSHRQADARQQRGPDEYLQRLTRELSLDETQHGKVKQVLDTYAPQMESLWAETRPRFETMRTELRRDISALLTAAQRTRYEEMIRRHDADRNARSSRARP